MSPTLLFILAGCGSVAPQLEMYDGPSNGRIGGVAMDDDGSRLAEVDVVLSNGMVTTTDADGLYAFSGVSPDDYVLTYQLDGFTRVYRKATVDGWERVSVNATLFPVGEIFTFDTLDGGSFQHDSTTVSIPAGNLVDSLGKAYSGEVELHLTGFDPRDFSSGAIPGPDDYRARRNGNDGALVTLGFFEATLYSPSGDELNLADGSPATIEMVDPGFGSDEYATDLWWFDPDLGLWMDEGEFRTEQNEDGVDVLVAQVPHFSWWNADWWYDWSLTCANGYVNDTLGNPLVGATVTLSADQINLVGRGDGADEFVDSAYSLSTTTDDTGYWELQPVNAANPYHTLSISYTTSTGELIELEEPYTTGVAAIEAPWDDSGNVDIPAEYCEPNEHELEVCALGAEFRVLVSESSGTELIETEGPGPDGSVAGKFTALGAATAWFFDPGSADECESPVVEVEMDSCVELPLSATPLDVIPDLSAVVGLPAGDQVAIDNTSFGFLLDPRTTSGQPYYIAYAFDETPLTGTTYDVTVPGAADGFPAYTEAAAVVMPTAIELADLFPGSVIDRMSGLNFTYNGEGRTDGVHVLIQTGASSIVCRQADSGVVSITGDVFDTLDAGAAFVSVWRSEIALHSTPTGGAARTVGTVSTEIAVTLE